MPTVAVDMDISLDVFGKCSSGRAEEKFQSSSFGAPLVDWEADRDAFDVEEACTGFKSKSVFCDPLGCMLFGVVDDIEAKGSKALDIDLNCGTWDEGTAMGV